MKVKDMMRKTVYSCDMQTSLNTVALSMWNNDCGCLPVVDAKNLPIGIITDRDIAIGAALQHKPLWELQVSDIVGSRPLFSCKTTDDIHGALQRMQEQGVRRLPVVNGNGKLAGIVTLGDIFAFVSESGETDLPYKDTLPMLKAVSAHHAELKKAG